MALPSDLENGSPKLQESVREQQHGDIDEPKNKQSMLDHYLSKIDARGTVEMRGSIPVPLEDRVVTQYFNIFSLWFCLSCNPLP